MSDIWTDMKECSFINVIAYSPAGAIFLKSFERSADGKEGLFLNDLLLSVIEEMGAENVVQIITNNASNYEVDGDMIVERYPHIYKTRCAAHGIQLLLQDIYKNIGWMKKIFDNAELIVGYMHKYTIIIDLMRAHINGRELKKPCKTRFASNFIMLQSIVAAEDGLRVLVVSSDWRSMDCNKSIIAQRVVDIIQSSSFWDEGRDILLILEPLVRVLRLVDGDGSTAAYLYEAMDRAREAIERRCHNDPTKYLDLWELFDKRRKQNILHETHAVAAFLNPSLFYNGKIRYDIPEVRDGLNYVLEKLIQQHERANFALELLHYSGKNTKLFTTLSLAFMTQAHPRVWWELNGGELPLLRKIAMRILSQPCSSSSCE